MTLKIVSSEFIISAPSLKEAPLWTFPEIAMVGRSNVGKSSFINTIIERKNLAKTSNTPGKTRLINFYKINDRFALVDLPGYGYAKVPKTTQAKWQRSLSEYLEKRKNLILVIQLIDARHGPQQSDEQMLSWLEYHKIPTVMLFTKGDKISQNELMQRIQHTTGRLNIKPDEIFGFSAKTGAGKDRILAFMEDKIEAYSTRAC